MLEDTIVPTTGAIRKPKTIKKGTKRKEARLTKQKTAKMTCKES